jgi:general stress protein YciG
MTNTKQPGGDTESTGGHKSGQQTQGGNRERDTDADRKGGSGSNKGGNQQGSGSGKSGQQSQGGSGNFADDPERASEAGRKGGHASHGGTDK